MARHDDETSRRETTDQEAWDLVRRAPVGRLAVVLHGAPDIVPVNHVVDHGSVVFRTTPGWRVSAAHRTPVAFEVDGWDEETNEAWSVVLHGRAVHERDLDARIADAALPVDPWQPGEKPVVVRIVPDRITTRRFARRPGLGTVRHSVGSTDRGRPPSDTVARECPDRGGPTMPP